MKCRAASVVGMETALKHLCARVIHASERMGSLLHVAIALEVEAGELYRWLAGVERPSDARIPELEKRTAQLLSRRPRRS